MRQSGMKNFFVIAALLLFSLRAFAGNAKAEAPRAEGAEIHYWSGQTRVDLVLALDEIQIEYDTEQPAADALKAGIPGFEKIETVNAGKKQSRVLFKKVANPKALSAQANAARKLKNIKSAAAVASQPSDAARAGTREVFSSRLV